LYVTGWFQGPYPMDHLIYRVEKGIILGYVNQGFKKEAFPVEGLVNIKSTRPYLLNSMDWPFWVEASNDAIYTTWPTYESFNRLEGPWSYEQKIPEDKTSIDIYEDEDEKL